MKAQFGTKAVISDLKNVVRDSEQLLESIADIADVEANEARQRLTKTLESARAVCRNLEDKTKRSLANVDDAIWNHPYQSIAVAVVVGLAAGALMGRKMRT